MKLPLRTLILAFLLVAVDGAFGGTVITNNLPYGTAIINIDARVDGAAQYAGPATLWYRPFNSTGGELLEYTLPPGTYTFRIVNPADAARLYPSLTSEQTNQIYTAWTYNNPWLTDYIVFDGSAATNSSVAQLFDGAPGPSFGDPVSAYNDAIANGYYNLIRTNLQGRVGSDFTNSFTFGQTTTLIFAIADYGLYDNYGGVSVVVAPTAAPDFHMDWFTIAGGGGTSADNQFTLSGVIGQPDAGQMSGSVYTIVGGFWSIATPIQTPGAPVLSVSIAGANLIVSWPESATGWVLEQTSTLAAPASWQTTQQSYTTNAGTISVSLPVAPGQQYFRLRHPPN